MTGFWPVKKFLLLLPLGLLFACTGVDDNLGADVVPDVDRMRIVTDTISSGFSIRSIRTDSMLTDNSANFYLGSTVFPRQGRINAAFLTQVSPGNLPDSNVFPDNVVVDSAYIILGNIGYIGVPNYELTLSIYELQKPLPYSKSHSYYSNFPVEEYISTVPQIITTVNSSDAIEVKVEDLSLVEKYMRATADQNTDEDLYNEISPGYYFKTSSTYGSGALFSINPSYSGIQIYYHDPEDAAQAELYEPTFAHIVTNSSTGYQSMLNEGFSFFDRDYSFTDPMFDFDPDSTTKSYVMGLVGYITEMTIPEEFVDKIRETLDGKIGGVVGILRAELVMPVNDSSTMAYNESLAAMALYYDFQGLDFMPSYTSSNTTTLGGVLNRAKGEYSFNVTSYIQELVRKGGGNYTLQVAPMLGDTYTFHCTELANSEERPVKLIITYTTNLQPTA